MLNRRKSSVDRMRRLAQIWSFSVVAITLIVAAASLAFSGGHTTEHRVPEVPVKDEDGTFSYPHLRPSTSDEEQARAVVDLIYRLIPDRAAEVTVQVNRSLLDAAGRDFFQVEASGGLVRVVGSTGVAAAWGLHHYLKQVCRAHVSWDSDQLTLPNPLPDASFSVRANDRFRYYQNVCTVSYSSVWWGWQRWQRELDWMALNGVNFALAFTGQEVIWRRVFMQLGLTKGEVDEFFTGPAFLAWNRMGNLQKFGGPLSDTWHQQQLLLAHQIIARMRQLGITPILPAFAGHVPQNFTKVFPEAPVSRLRCWGRFNSTYSCINFLQPDSAIYRRVGTLLIQQLQKEFNGTEHVYNCDSFNEMTPPSSDPAYLSSVGRATLAAMTNADPQAVWLMQGWLFLSDFWKPEQAKAYLTSVPTGSMIVLDLYSEAVPIYSTLQSYYGQPFIWCMLHNFGGQLGLQGAVPALVKGPLEGRNFTNSSMIGTGLTMEGISQNYVVYDLMLEMAWRTTSPDPVQWAGEYAARRYGPQVSQPDPVIKAWNYLITSVYDVTYDTKVVEDLGRPGVQFFVIQRPNLNMVPQVWYNLSDLVSAWDLLVSVPAAEARESPNLLHDLVDVTREVLAQLTAEYYSRAVNAYNNKNLLLLHEEGAVLADVLTDMDEVLNTNKDFLLGAWIRDAKANAANDQERTQYEYNARNQLTLWGPDGNILDYAAKQWAGLVADYYRPRWELFIKYLEERLWHSSDYNQTELNQRMFDTVEQAFTFNTTFYTPAPVGDTVEVVRRVHDKYRPALPPAKPLEF